MQNINSSFRFSTPRYPPTNLGKKRNIENDPVSQVAFKRLRSGEEIDQSLSYSSNSKSQNTTQQQSFHSQGFPIGSLSANSSSSILLSEQKDKKSYEFDDSVLQKTYERYLNSTKTFENKLNEIKTKQIQNIELLKFIKQTEEEDAMAVDHLWKSYFSNLQNVILNGRGACLNLNFPLKLTDELSRQWGQNISKQYIDFKNSLDKTAASRITLIEDMTKDSYCHMMEHMISRRNDKIELIIQKIERINIPSLRPSLEKNKEQPLTREDWDGVFELLENI